MSICFRIIKIIVLIYGLICSSAISLAQQQSVLQNDLQADLRIMLQAYTFDPLEQTPDIRQQLRIEKIPKSAAYRIVQFNHSLTREQAELLITQFGLKLDLYIPNYAYLEKITQSKIDSLSQLRFFRWSGLYQPAYKIDPPTDNLTFETEERKAIAGLLFSITRFSDAELDEAAEALRKEGAQVLNSTDDTEVGGYKRIQLIVSSQKLLPHLAAIEAVQWIEEVPERRLRNGTTTSVVQSGTAGTTPMWNQGLHGEGQVLGIIDDLPI